MTDKEKKLSGATNTEQRTDESPSNKCSASITQKNSDVNILRELREQNNADEIIAAVQTMHPKYDKTLQSKCEHTNEYGVCLEPNAMKMLIDRFAHLPSSTEKEVRKDNHKLHDRAACRIEADTMQKLKAKMKQDGFTTVQGCVYFLIKAYIGDNE